jgi:hypothetical protein
MAMELDAWESGCRTLYYFVGTDDFALRRMENLIHG